MNSTSQVEREAQRERPTRAKIYLGERMRRVAGLASLRDPVASSRAQAGSTAGARSLRGRAGAPDGHHGPSAHRRAEAHQVVQHLRDQRRRHHGELGVFRCGVRRSQQSSVGARISGRLRGRAGTERERRPPRRPFPAHHQREPVRARGGASVRGVVGRDLAFLWPGRDLVVAVRSQGMAAGDAERGAPRAVARALQDRLRRQPVRRHIPSRRPAGTSPPTRRRPSRSRSWFPSSSIDRTSRPKRRCNGWGRRSSNA